MSGEPCFLLGLPQELLFSAVDYIESRRDLYNLSLTCRALEDVCLRRLYADVTFDANSHQSLGKNSSRACLLRSHVVDFVQELTVRDGVSHARSLESGRSRACSLSSFNEGLFRVLQAIPLNHLRAFSFYHRSALSPQILEVLASHHNLSLQNLWFYDLDASTTESLILPNRLTTLGCRSIGDGRLIRDLVYMNCRSLQRLSLGQEKELLRQYTPIQLNVMEVAQTSTLLGADLLNQLSSLRELELSGLDVRPLIPLDVEDALPFCKLTKLSIQSCAGSPELLRCLLNTFEHVQEPSQPRHSRPTIHLREFQFRTEVPTTTLKEILILFLNSFAGLETLSLLFENGTVLERVSTFLGGHGPTLRTLVMESRIQSRDNLGLDTSRPFGAGGYSQELWEQSINDICHLCPNLIELGIGFPWDDELVRIRKTQLPTLAQLKTIHIRNFPENRAFSQIGDYTIKAYAHKFVDWVFPTLVGGHKPALETLAIGPTLYESRWRFSDTKQALPEFKRTHYFGVDWAVTRFSRWSFMVSPMSVKYMEETRGERPLKGAFEQVWLK